MARDCGETGGVRLEVVEMAVAQVSRAVMAGILYRTRRLVEMVHPVCLVKMVIMSLEIMISVGIAITRFAEAVVVLAQAEAVAAVLVAQALAAEVVVAAVAVQPILLTKSVLIFARAETAVLEGMVALEVAVAMAAQAETAAMVAMVEGLLS